MNNNPRFVKKRLSLLIAAGLLTGLGSAAYANDFSLSSNQLTIKNTVGEVVTTIATATLGSDGVLDAAGDNLPNIDLSNTTLSGGMPTFEFRINSEGLRAGNTSNSFKIGLSIVDDNAPTTRRFEAFIGELTLNVDGSGNVTGTIPSQNMQVRAKKGSATFYEAINNPSSNGPFRIEGGNLTFSGSDAVTLLKAKGDSVLDGILDGFTLNGTFTFRVVIEENLPGPTAARVGFRSAGGTFTPVPRITSSLCEASPASTVGNVFALFPYTPVGGGADILTGFSRPYVVQGRFTSGQTVANTSATAFTESCAVAGGGGGGGGGGAAAGAGEEAGAGEGEVVDNRSREELEDAANEIDGAFDGLEDQEGPIDDAVLAVIDGHHDTLKALAKQLDTSIAAEIASGTISTETAASTKSLATRSASTSKAITTALAKGGTVSKASILGALTSSSSSAVTASKVFNSSGLDEETKKSIKADKTSILQSSRTMLENIATSRTELTTAEEDDVRTSSKNLVSTAIALAEIDATDEELEDIAAQTNSVVASQARLGIPADSELINSVATASKQLGERKIALLVPNSEQLTTEEITAVLTENTALADEVLDNSLSVPASVTIPITERTDRISQAFPSLTTEAATRAAEATENIVNPSSITLSSGDTALTFLDNFLSAPTVASPLLSGLSGRRSVAALQDGETEIVVDDATGAITISAGSETYAAMVIAVREVPTALPNGLRLRTDGRFTIVSDGTAMDLAAIAYSVGGFIELAETAGFAYTQNTDASFSLDLGDSQTFSGVFAYDNLASADLDSACGTISVTSPQGAINSASYAFGIDCANGVSQRVLPYSANADFLASFAAAGMAATTDRITGIISVDGVGLLKPGFFTAAPTADELTFHAANTDSLGIAMQTLDFNSDGIDDYKVISATTVQIMYGVK